MAAIKPFRKNTNTFRKLEANHALHAVDFKASEIMEQLKKNNESCRTCHYFCNIPIPVKNGVSTTEKKTVCRLKQHKPVMYYNLCHLWKKLDVQVAAKNDLLTGEEFNKDV